MRQKYSGAALVEKVCAVLAFNLDRELTDTEKAEVADAVLFVQNNPNSLVGEIVKAPDDAEEAINAGDIHEYIEANGPEYDPGVAREE